MIQIDPATMIGKGKDRACYIYPEDLEKCVKITQPSKDNKQSRNDLKYYRKLLKRKISWKMLAKFYGTVETDMGEGLLFERIFDFDGTTSKSLRYYLKENEIDKIPDIVENLKALHTYLLSEKIIVRDLLAHNVLCRRLTERKSELVIIDGIGNSDFIPIADYMVDFARKKIDRRWWRFIRTLREYFTHNKLFLEKLGEYGSKRVLSK